MAEYTIDKLKFGGNVYKLKDSVSGYKTTDSDTKNTAGSTDTSSKIFLIGATSQAANPQTYSHDTAYVGTDGCLYSGGTKVLTAHQSLAAPTITADTSSTSTITLSYGSKYKLTTPGGSFVFTMPASDNTDTWRGIQNNLTSDSTTDSLSAAQGKALKALIDGLPTPMQFKGSVGTGGTITSLPTAASTNSGHVYKVITALSNPSAKVGDTVISNGSAWTVIPSGDEPSGTVTSVAASGSGGISISGSPITSSGTISIGLNLSTAINGLSEGSSNATREDYVVTQYAGGGTTTTTYHRRKLSNIFAALNASDITTALGYTPPTANTNTTYSLTQDSSNGHKITLTPSSGTAQTITIPDNNTTYTVAAGDANGQIKVTPSSGSTYNVSVTGLASAAYKGVTDNSSNADVASSDTNLITGRTLYYQLAKKGYTTNTGTITGITMNGASKGTSGVVDLGTVITSHQDISGKADKSATVSTIAWGSNKLTKTINGTTTDVVTAATLKSAIGAVSKSSVTGSLTTSGWSSKSQTISVSGVTTSNDIVVAPAPSSATAYADAGILCTAQGSGTLTFTCETVPSAAITVNILVLS